MNCNNCNEYFGTMSNLINGSAICPKCGNRQIVNIVHKNIKNLKVIL